MESALRPREIQTRIRSGESVEDVARAAGVPVERIEPFAGPVLAEREHVAAQAQRSSARRRGEGSGHRELRAVVAERLGTRSIDPETVVWDSYRLDDGRWAVTATYASGEATRQALFHFDPRGRFSVAGNDEARWVLGEQSPVHGPQPGRQPRRPGSEDPDSEPTLELSDELALVRAIQERPVDASAAADDADAADAADDEEDGPAAGRDDAAVVEVTEVAVTRLEVVTEDPAPTGEDTGSGRTPASATTTGTGTEDEAPVEQLDEASELDLLYDMLGGVGYSEDSGRVYPGLAGEEPEGDLGWEPGVTINYPVEPEPESGEQLIDDVTGGGLDPHRVRTRTEPTLVDSDPVETHPSDDTSQEEGESVPGVEAEPSHPETDEDGPGPELPPAPGGNPDDDDATLEDAVPDSPEAPATIPPELQDPPQDRAPETARDAAPEPAPESEQRTGTVRSADGLEQDALVDVPSPAPAKPARRKKRAEVPSWDEIMFGGPKRD